MSWERLDPRGMLVTAVVLGGVGVAAGVPTAVGIGSGSAGYGTALAWVLPAIAVLMVAGAGVEYVRYRRTRFRIGPDRVELRNGILALHHRTLPRERIRVVDLSADPLSRVLGLTQVRIGTGEQGGEGLTLWPVPAATGERLRAELLTRGRGTDRDGTLGTFRPGWLRYGPVSYLTPALGLAAVGVLFQGAQWIGQENALVDWFGGLAVLVGVVWLVVLGIAAVAVVGTVAALAVYAELWWNHRLDREPGGTLRVRRGLLTTRSISMEERRLRGVELVEPLGARLVGAARVDAVVTGMKQPGEEEKTESRTLLPAAPRAVALRVAGAVLGEPVLETPLEPHPPAARARRIRWGLSVVAGVALVLLVLGLTVWWPLVHAAWIAAVLGTPVAFASALDAYRALGHALTDRHLVARHGAVRRSTVALDRSGVVGWTVRRTVFQRRAGLITLRAATATGAGAYSLPDVGEAEGLKLAHEVGGEIVAQFVDDQPATTAGSMSNAR